MTQVSQRIILAMALSISLFLVGSCNERSTFFDFSSKKPNLAEMDKGQLLRHAYSVQAGLMNKPDDISKLRHSDIELALAEPDLARVEGESVVWQYRANSCVLDVYWQDNKTAGEIDHHEFRARQTVSQTGITENEINSSWACLQNIIEMRRAQIEQNLLNIYAVLSLNAQRS